MRLCDRRAEIARVARVVEEIYTRAATTPKRRQQAGPLAKIIAYLWAEDANAGRAPAQFRDIGDDRLRQELARLAQLDAHGDIVDECKKIHEPTILVLADFGFIRERDDRARLVEAAKRALAARAYVRPKTKPSKGRSFGEGVKGAPTNNRAAAARVMLAAHYKLLTGRRPTVTGASSDYGTPARGVFLHLTAAVFKALNIGASAEAQARAVAYPKKER